MTDYVILATIRTDMPQEQFRAYLQQAYDGGAAGSFDSHATEGGFQVVFFRYNEERDSGIPETVEQLAREIEEAEIEPGAPDATFWVLSDIAKQIRATAWKAVPYGRH